MTMKPGAALAVALLLLAAAPAVAQTDEAGDTSDVEAPEASAPPWLMTCSNQQDPAVLLCEVSQSILLTQANQRVATVSFARAAGQTETQAVFLLPVGVLLPAGITLSVDGTEVGRMDYDSCDAQGCLARADVEDTWLQAMRDGGQLTLGLTTRDGQAIGLNFQLDGFADVERLFP